LPVLFLAPVGGHIADTSSKRKILFFTQSLCGIFSVILGALAITNHTALWVVYFLSLLFGLITVVEHPTRHALISEIVVEGELKNAITLNAGLINMARFTGPALAGFIIAIWGMGACFVASTVFFALAIIFLTRVRIKKAIRDHAPQMNIAQFSEGFRYIFSKPIIVSTLFVMAIVGTLSYEFPVSLALLAKNTFASGAAGYGALTSVLGLGSIIGSIFTARGRKTSSKMVIATAIFFGLSMLLASIMPSLFWAAVAMAIVGIFSIYFASLVVTILQLESLPEMRGRVMSLFSMCYLGSTAIGVPIIGFVGQHAGPRWSLAVGGIAALVAAGLGALLLRKMTTPRYVPEEILEEAEENIDDDRRM
jgi:MFS family permease